MEAITHKPYKLEAESPVANFDVLGNGFPDEDGADGFVDAARRFCRASLQRLKGLYISYTSLN
jgi:hypothetical protein